MTTEKILQSLCYYDKRNPDCSVDDECIDSHKVQMKKSDVCYCENCFYGRTELAEELLRIMGKNNIL